MASKKKVGAKKSGAKSGATHGRNENRSHILEKGARKGAAGGGADNPNSSGRSSDQVSRSASTGRFTSKALGASVLGSDVRNARGSGGGSRVDQSNRTSALRPVTATRQDETSLDVVLVREFHPDRGFVVIEFKNNRRRYTQERTPEQVIAIADYLRARRGFSSDQEMAEVLDVHRTRLIAWKQGSELPNPQNAHLLSHLAVVVTELQEFLDLDVIPDWLLTEQYTLGGRTPVRALREGMLAEVLQTANATEHGAFI